MFSAIDYWHKTFSRRKMDQSPAALEQRKSIMPQVKKSTATVPSRRRFLQGACAGAISLAAVGRARGDEPVAPKASAAEAVGKSPAPGKIPFELGLASYTFHAISLDCALALTGRLGLKHICLKSTHLPLDSTPEKIAEVAAQVKQAGLDLYGCGVVSMGKAADVEQAFRYAKAAGMRIIVAMPTPDLLPLINDKVQQFDIRLAIHNHGPGDNKFPSPLDAYRAVKDLDRRVGLCIDIGHTLRIGVDPADAARRCADRLLDMHIKDESAAAPSGHCLEMGRGVMDIPGLFRTLIDIGYSGFASFEYEKDMKDPLVGLAESVGYARGVLAGIRD
jgi:sugar phosphate isomerase/epimerase